MLVVGAADWLCILSQNLTEEGRLYLPPQASRAACSAAIGYNPDYVCRNHLRVFPSSPTDPTRLVVCGSEAIGTPSCRAVNISNLMNFTTVEAANGTISIRPDFYGHGIAYNVSNPRGINFFSVSTLTLDANNTGLFFLTVNYTNPTDPNSLYTVLQLRTNSIANFKAPVFVDTYRANYAPRTALLPGVMDTISPDEHKYFYVFLRDVDTTTQSIISQVARVCQNDPGNSADNAPLTLVKARINCMSAQYSTNYNSIRSVAFNQMGRYYQNGDWSLFMYGVFTTTIGGVEASAVCIYPANNSVNDATGRYGRNGGVFDIFRTLLVNPNTGVRTTSGYVECTSNGNMARPDYTYTDTVLPINQIGTEPLIVINNLIITKIVLDQTCVITNNISANTCVVQDVLFLGTAVGTVLKVTIGYNNQSTSSIASEEIKLNDASSVRQLDIKMQGGVKYLYVNTDTSIYRLPVQRCDRYFSCSSCVGSRDPYCVWNTSLSQCVVSSIVPTNYNGSATVPNGIYQNIHTGVLNGCPALPMNCSSSISGPSQPVFIGSTISFMCDASDCHNGSTINSYQWVKDGAILTDGGRVSGTTQSTLSVSSVTLQDQGMYQCSAINVDGISGELSNSTQITVYDVMVTSQPQNLTNVLPGRMANFSVTAAGADSFTFQWQYGNGTNIPPRERYGATLSATFGQNASLSCSANGLGPLTVHWTTPPGITPPQSRHYDGYDITDTLVLSSVNTTHRGTYMCVVTDSRGTEASSMPSILGVRVPSSNAVAMANLQVGMFSCTSNDGVGGATITSYQWVKNGVALSNGGRVAGANQPTLSISNVMPQDQGLYQCNVTNVDGVTSLSISSSFVVSGETCAIVKKSQLDETYVLTLDTVIVTQPSNQSGVAPGSNVTFSVYAVHVVGGDGGSISYVWTYSNGSQLAGDRFQGTNTSALTISPVLGSDNGSFFICTVSGSSGVYITSQPVSLNALGYAKNYGGQIGSSKQYFISKLNFDAIPGMIVAGGVDWLYILSQNLTEEGRLYLPPQASRTACSAAIGYNPDYVCRNHIRVFTSSPIDPTRLLVCGSEAIGTPSCRAVNISNLMNFTAVTAANGTVSIRPDFYGSGIAYNVSNPRGINFFSVSTLNLNANNTGLFFLTVNYTNPTDPNSLYTVLQLRTNSIANFKTPVFVDTYKANYAPRTALLPGVMDTISPDEHKYFYVFVRDIDTDTHNDPGNSADNAPLTLVKARINCNSAKYSTNYNAITNNSVDDATGRYGRNAGVFDIFRTLLVNPNTGILTTSGYVECTPNGNMARPDYTYTDTVLPITQIGTEPLAVIKNLIVTKIVLDQTCVITNNISAKTCVVQDVLFLGTAVGTVLKVAIGYNNQSTYSITAEEVKLNDASSVRQLDIKMQGGLKYLYVNTDTSIYRLPVQRCGRYLSCRDPYCVWNTSLSQCVVSSIVPTNYNGSASVPNGIYQNIHTGVVNGCPVFPMNASSSLFSPSQPVFIGSTISFVCNASGCQNGSTINSYRWVKDGAILTDGGRVSGTTQSTLSVSSVTLQDQGMYQCSAINVDGISGELSNSTQITVYDVMVTSQPQNLTNVLPGRMANFSVTAAGADSFTFQWKYGNGTNIPPGDRYQATLSVTFGQNALLSCSANGLGPLTVHWTTPPGITPPQSRHYDGYDITDTLVLSSVNTTHRGTYMCVVTDGRGTEVLSMPSMLRVIVPLSNTIAMANLLAGMFSCTSNDGVGGATITSYQWVKNGVALSNGGRVAGANQPTLSISNVMPQDQGLYQCNVTNVDGVTRLSISSSFVVSGEPCAIVKKRELDEMFVLTLDTVIVTQPSNQSGVAPGSIVTFSVYAVPVVGGDGGSISYVWTYSNGSQLAGDRFQGINTSTLTISSVLGSDNGSSFICTVSGSSGVYVTSQPVSLNSLGYAKNYDGQIGSSKQYFISKLNFDAIPGMIVAGGVDWLYILSQNLTEEGRLYLPPQASRAACSAAIGYNPDYVCRNHIRVFTSSPTDPTRLLVCGSEAIGTPSCRAVNISNLMNFTAVTAANGTVSIRPDFYGSGIAYNVSNPRGINFFSVSTLNLNANNTGLFFLTVNYTNPTDPNSLYTVLQLRTNSIANFKTPVFVDTYRANYAPRTALLPGVMDTISPDEHKYFYVFVRDIDTDTHNDPGNSADNAPLTLVKARINCNSAKYSTNYNAITSNSVDDATGRYGRNGGVFDIFRTLLVNPNTGILTTSGYVECTPNGNLARPDYTYTDTVLPITQIGTEPLAVIKNLIITKIVLDQTCVITNNISAKTCVVQDVLFLGTAVGTVLKVAIGYNNQSTYSITAEEIKCVVSSIVPTNYNGSASVPNGIYQNIHTGVVSSCPVFPMNASSSISGPSQPVFIGSTISFVCNASGCQNGSTINSYRWVKDGAILTDGGRVSGTTQSTLSVSSVTLQDQGMYQCSAINVDGISGELSNSTQITVYDVMVTSQPQNLTNVLPGRMANFSVTAAGADSFTFQWKYGNGTNIPPGDRYQGVTTPTLVIFPVIGDNSSVYVCRVTSPSGNTTTTQPAYLMLASSPVITQQPTASLSVTFGQNTSLSCSANGLGPLTVHWTVPPGMTPPQSKQYDGYVIIDTLVLSSVNTTHRGTYMCVVTDRRVPFSNTVAMANLLAGMFSCTSNDGVGGATITSYQWVKNGVALSNGGRVTGANQPTLSISNVMPQDQGLYQCNVTNVDGVTSLSISSSFVVSGEPCAIVKKRELDETYVLTLDTVIVTQPSNQSGVAPGSIVTFSVNGSQLAGDRFQGTNTSALTISPVLGSDNGSSFICTVSGSSGVYVTSQPVSLNILDSAIVSNERDTFLIRLRTFFNLQSFGPALELFTLRIGYCISSSWGKDQLLELDLEVQTCTIEMILDYVCRSHLRVFPSSPTDPTRLVVCGSEAIGTPSCRAVNISNLMNFTAVTAANGTVSIRPDFYRSGIAYNANGTVSIRPSFFGDAISFNVNNPRGINFFSVSLLSTWMPAALPHCQLYVVPQQPQGLWTRYRANYAPRTALLPGVMNTISPDEHKYFYVFTRDVDTTITSNNSVDDATGRYGRNGGVFDIFRTLLVNPNTGILTTSGYMECTNNGNMARPDCTYTGTILAITQIGAGPLPVFNNLIITKIVLDQICVVTNNISSRTCVIQDVLFVGTDYLFRGVVDTSAADVMVTSQPQNVTNVLPGRMASFSVTAAGADSFTFQWQYGNGTNIPPGDRYGDVTTPTLVISSVIGGDNSSVLIKYHHFYTSTDKKHITQLPGIAAYQLNRRVHSLAQECRTFNQSPLTIHLHQETPQLHWQAPNSSPGTATQQRVASIGPAALMLLSLLLVAIA
eukprot:Em0024g136a